MFPEPRVIRRALNREIQRDFEAVRVRGGQHATKVVERAQLRMHGGVAAFRCADRVRAAYVAGLCVKRVVAALAVGKANG